MFCKKFVFEKQNRPGILFAQDFSLGPGKNGRITIIPPVFRPKLMKTRTDDYLQTKGTEIRENNRTPSVFAHGAFLSVFRFLFSLTREFVLKQKSLSEKRPNYGRNRCFIFYRKFEKCLNIHESSRELQQCVFQTFPFLISNRPIFWN